MASVEHVKPAADRLYFYGLSTCGWCAKARSWMDQHLADYELVYVDLLDSAAQEETVASLRQWADPVAFPLVIMNDEAVVGYRPEEYTRLLGA